jgi:hypothetical protein
MELMKTLLATFTVFGLAFLLLNIRYLFTGKEFRGTCASNFQSGKEGQVCSMCGRRPDEECGMPEVK